MNVLMWVPDWHECINMGGVCLVVRKTVVSNTRKFSINEGLCICPIKIRECVGVKRVKVEEVGIEMKRGMVLS